ncbi:MAG: molybdopterin-dependent oxidoreductase [Steroidobacteraceae bacterium]
MANLDRRDFLKLVGVGGVGVGAGFMLAESIKQPLEHLIPYPVPPEEFSAGIATWYNSVCSMCTSGCGISVRTREGRPKIIQGNPAHPVSQGRLCNLGQAGVQRLYNPDRLSMPLMRASRRGGFEPVTWEEGLSKVAERLRALRTKNAGDRVYLLSEGVRGHLSIVFERFMQQLGSEHLLHYEFAHPGTLYAANERLFGERYLPYYDIKNTRYLLSFGADFLSQWLSPVHHSIGFGHSRQGRDGVRGTFVQIEPRMSMTGAVADEWIPARPGTEGLLALGIAWCIVDGGHYNGRDRDAWSSALSNFSTERVARATDVPQATIARLAERFAGTQPSLAIGGGGAANHKNGVDILMAVNTLNHLVGSVGVAGGLVFNPPPIVGADAPNRNASYRMMTELVKDARDGRVDTLILNETNPLFSLPEAAKFEAALANIPFIVSLSSFMDETTAHADLILPSHTYLESWGDDFPEPGVGFPVGAISQPVVSPLYDTRATGDIVLNLAHRLGFDKELPWTSMKDCLKQGWQQIYQRGAPAAGAESFEAFWSSVLQAGVWGQDAHRVADAPVTIDSQWIAGMHIGAEEGTAADDGYPFALHLYLSSGLHDGRGANLPWMQELPDPLTSVVYGSWIELNPATAKKLGVAEGDVVDVQSAHGRISAPVVIYPAIRPDVVAMPIGQGHSGYGRYAQHRGSNPIQILAPEIEPSTGALAWSATRVKLTRTGRSVKLLKTDGTTRELGRNILPSTNSAGHTARLQDIPIKVVHT